MKKFLLPYGKSNIIVEFKNNHCVDEIVPVDHAPSPNPFRSVENALKNPIDSINNEIFNQNLKVGIAINDPTRPIPHSILLPPLMELLQNRGIKKNDICLYIATGTHKSLNTDGFISILPKEIIDQYQVVSHDCDDQNNLKYIGTTKRNTPIFINKSYLQCEIKIVVGDIEPHHFQGYSGGAKSAAIGLAGRNTINRNHKMLMDSRAFIGNYENNPVRQDVEEIGDMIGIYAALNAVLNIKKEIVEVFWGSPRGVMRTGIPVSRKICQLRKSLKYDLVIASPGGYPKDINLYQAQKALTHAGLFVKENGVIILVAACKEGIGSNQYLDFMDGLSSFSEVINKFNQVEFSIGPHKAYQIAKQGLRNKIILVSDIEPSLVKKTLLMPMTDVKMAIEFALQLLPFDLSIALLPFATNTILMESESHDIK